MKTHFEVLIIGGGNAGISIASQLLLKKSTLDIGIIEPSEKHYYQPAWTLVAGGDFDMQKTIRPQQSVMPSKATWIKNSVATFQPEKNEVTCTNNDKYTYNYLVVVPGIQLDWHKIKGAKEALGKNGVTSNYLPHLPPYTWQLACEFKGGNAIFTNPNTPIKCGGAPQKIMYLLSDYFSKQNILSKTQVHFYSGGGVIFGVKKYADTLNKVIARYGINTHFKHNLVEVKASEKIAVFETTDAAGATTLVSQPYDLLHITPPQSAPDFIKFSALAIADTVVAANTPCMPSKQSANFLGWVDVNKHTLQHNKFPNIFSCGDVANTPNAKTGAAIRKQAPVLVANLLSLLNGQPVAAAYNGYGSCPLVTGYGKLVMAEFDYDNQPTETFPFDQSKERWSMYALKKYLLPWLYWNKILKGTA